jgi:hypothetical protein
MSVNLPGDDDDKPYTRAVGIVQTCGARHTGYSADPVPTFALHNPVIFRSVSLGYPNHYPDISRSLV